MFYNCSTDSPPQARQHFNNQRSMDERNQYGSKQKCTTKLASGILTRSHPEQEAEPLLSHDLEEQAGTIQITYATA
jgi:hypothetical protein